MKKVTLLMALILFCSWQVVLAQKTITGKVTDANDGSTLPGVNVVVKGTTTGTVTDMNGAYSIKAPANAQTLVFSFVGYQNSEIAIAGQSEINVALTPSAEQLKEVVVTALGIRRDQKALGYAMSTVSAKELTKVGSTNFGSALYGKASGVRIATAPGGATSAVSINIRGINSITGRSQPLIVVDGIPIRNGEVNNGGYWDDQRIRGNGLIDINPEDIDNVSILKGASAAALYGSEGANGVVLITTKSGAGMKKGLGVEANITYTFENATTLPKFQNTYGPGYDKGTNVAVGANDEGWFMVDLNGDGVNETYRPYFRAYGQFGPKFDGREVIGWDGKMHPYVAQENNYKDFFQTGSNGIYNIAVTHGGEKSNFRLSYTRADYKGIQKGGNQNKNSFSINGTMNLSSKLTTTIVADYINQHIHNRPEMISRITNNYGGFFSRFDDMAWYYDKYKTSKGYKYVYGASTPSITPEENLVYNIRAYDLMEFMWRNLENSYDEYNNRLIGNITTTYEIFKGIKLRGRIGTDYTSLLETNKNKNEVPLSLGNSGYYGQGSTLFNHLYGDVLLMIDKKITDDFGVIFNAGVTGNSRETYWQSSGTQGGLSVENWFNNSASVGTVTGSSGRNSQISQAILGTIGLNYKTFLYVEGTARQEKFSTLPPKSNSTFYPSVNSSFIFSEVLDLPKFVDYGKFRVSYGVVGVPAELYSSSIAYSQAGLNGVIYNSLQSAYGNEGIKPEEKHEFEIGLEAKFFQNRLGFELTYYNSKVKGQILQETTPISTGYSSMLANVGDLSNKGVEFSAYGTPVQGTHLRWDVRTNFAVNKNKITKLANGLDVLVHTNYDADAVRLMSKVGEPMGDFYTYVPLQLNGKPVIEDGYYKIDFSEMKKVGNMYPKIVGGLANTLTYDDFFVDFLIDYRFGGDILSLGNHYMMGAGMFEETMQYRDEANGGAAYYVDADGKNVATTASAGPNGEKVYHDGVILDGVKADGTPNDVIVDAANYYLNTFTWGLNSSWAPMTRYDLSIHKNSYIKLREVTLGYNIPKSLAQKIGFQHLTVSLIGRNICYFYKTLPNADPEVALGTTWRSQAIDAGSSAATRSLGFSIRAGF